MNLEMMSMNRLLITALAVLAFSCTKNEMEYSDNLSRTIEIDVDKETKVEIEGSTEEIIKEVEVIVKGQEKLSSLSFAGISSITDVTDSSVRINWASHAEAIHYEIYRIQSNSMQLLKSIEAPATSYLLSDLTNGTTYSFRVNLRDNKGLKDSNTNDQSVTTLTAPTAPNAMANQSPGVSPSFVDTPTIRIGGIKAGDTIKLYSESTCTTEIGSAVATGDTIDITTSTLAAGTYAIHAQAIGIHDNPSACSTVSVSYEALFCPEGYITIPGNSTFSTSDFCVMKYEAKAFKNDTELVDEDGCGEAGCTTTNWAPIYHAGSNPTGYKPMSVIEGKPWRSISQNNAKIACANLGTGYGLINNPEWMTIAHNIESVNANWSNGTVGDGHLNRGHSDNNPATPCDAVLENVHTDCSTTGADFHQKRTHTLTNSEVIWDIAGNIWQWVDWNITPNQKAYLSSDGMPLAAWREFSALHSEGVLTSPSDPMATWTWSPFNTSFNSTQNIGRYLAGINASGGAARRGGAIGGGSGGIFTLFLSNSASDTNAEMGLRCVFRP
jgi:hypothetical protein